MVAYLEGHAYGVTHVRWSPDGRLLFTGGRKDDELLCWDVRNTCSVLARFPRVCRDNQRMQFDIDPLGGRYLVTGSQDGRILAYDLLTAPSDGSGGGAEQHVQPTMTCEAAQAHSSDVVCAVSFHPFYSRSYPLLASASGHRSFTSQTKFASSKAASTQSSAPSSLSLTPTAMDVDADDSSDDSEPREPSENSLKLWVLH